MDFALFLLIILAFYNSGKFLTHKLWRIKFTGSGEAILFPVALGSIVISGIMTALLFLGWTKPETCWVVLGVLLLLGWKNLLYLKNAVASFHFFKAPKSQEVADAGLKTMAQSFLGLLVRLSLALAPAFAFLSILLVTGLEQGFQKYEASVGKKEKLFLSLILALGLLFNISTIMKEWFRIEPLSSLFKKESRVQFLTRQIRAYPLYWAANHMGGEDKVLLVYMRNLGYLMDRPFYSDTFFEAHTLKEIIDEEVYAKDIIKRLKTLGITHILFNHQFVFGENSSFSLGERGILKNFLNHHAQRILVKNEFFLYRFMLNS